MWRFAADCQIMVVLYAGVLHSRGRIQAQLGGNIDREKPFAVATDDRDGNVGAVWAWLPRGNVFDAFSAGGEFEQTFGKAFVVFAYQRWEEFARPRIAEALGTKHADVKSDVMGEWRHLRHCLHAVVNPDGLPPGLQLSAVDPSMKEQLSAQAEPGYILQPIWKGFGPPADSQC